MNRSTWLSLTLIPTLTGLLAGCGGRVEWNRTDQEKHAQQVASLYSEFKQSKGSSPKSTAELKEYIKGLKAEELQRRGITDVNQVLISPRDGQEYVIVPTPKKAPMGMTKVVFYEKTGINGKRWVVGTQGNIAEMTDEQLDKVLQEVGAKRGS